MTQRTYRILLTPEEEGGFSVSVLLYPAVLRKVKPLMKLLRWQRKLLVYILRA